MKFASILSALMFLAVSAVAPAGAQQVFGGHDETSEPNAGLWTVQGLTPGTAGPVAAAPDAAAP